MVTEKQARLLAKLFRRTGRTFQQLAKEAGLKTIPDHMCEMTKYDADMIINAHRGFLNG